ncbi:MAG: hypothetical protein E7627_04650 [Ruminococcaceae bacterium]|nr:hypothetical protein [Oscillospiraceae bacterium]
MRKVIKILFTVCLALIMLSVTVSARSEYSNRYTAYRDIIPKYDQMMEHLYMSVTEGDIYVSLASYELKEEDLVAIFNDLVAYSPELFFLNSKITYRYFDKNGVTYVAGLYFSYNYQGRELREAQRDFEEQVDYIASLVDPEMSDAEKALFVHDYMESLYTYDSELNVYDAYRIMTGEYGVCKAYALAYSAVLEKLGMECIMVVSNEMNHAWNLVQIDGKWYHVDLVYNDPGCDKPGRVWHDYFLLSDSEISEREEGAHTGWATALVCDESYGGFAPWEGRKTQLTYLGGRWYYIDEETMSIARVDWNSRESETVYTFNNRWYTNSKRTTKWVGLFSGLSAYDGKLVFNTDRYVVSLDPESGEQRVLFEADFDEQISGVMVHKDELKCYISYNINGNDESYVKRVKLSDDGKELPEKPDGVDDYSKLPFTDVPWNHERYTYIAYVYNRGLFTGVSETKFAPESNLTRAMFVTVLGRLCEVDISEYNKNVFYDVPPGQWYSPYVSWAALEGIVNGIGNRRFDPMGELTREQMYKIVAHCAVILTGIDTVTAAELPFADRDSISAWAYDSVKYCIEWGLVNGHDGDLDPTAKVTRAEAAEIIARLSRLLGK